jgi:uncharacterized OsmC-like protein
MHPKMEGSMPNANIREAIEKVSKIIADQPEKARAKNAPATAVFEGELRCRVIGPAGETLQTDMPVSVGGGATAPAPGWLMRAALASCNATCIAMRAAQLGVNLTKLEVTVSSETDNRGMLGLNDGISAGMQGLRSQVKISAPGMSAEELKKLVHWGASHSPVGCTNATSANVDIEIV